MAYKNANAALRALQKLHALGKPDIVISSRAKVISVDQLRALADAADQVEKGLLADLRERQIAERFEDYGV